ALDLAVTDLGHELGVGDVLAAATAGEARGQHDHEGEAEQDPEAPLGHALVAAKGAPRTTLVARRGRRRRGQTLRAHSARIRGGWSRRRSPWGSSAIRAAARRARYGPGA